MKVLYFEKPLIFKTFGADLGREILIRACKITIIPGIWMQRYAPLCSQQNPKTVRNTHEFSKPARLLPKVTHHSSPEA